MKGNIQSLIFAKPDGNTAKLTVEVPFDTYVSETHTINLGMFGALEFARHFDPRDKTGVVAWMNSPFQLSHSVTLLVNKSSTGNGEVSVSLDRENLPEGWSLKRVETVYEKTVYLDIKRQE